MSTDRIRRIPISWGYRVMPQWYHHTAICRRSLRLCDDCWCKPGQERLFHLRVICNVTSTYGNERPDPKPGALQAVVVSNPVPFTKTTCVHTRRSTPNPRHPRRRLFASHPNRTAVRQSRLSVVSAALVSAWRTGCNERRSQSALGNLATKEFTSIGQASLASCNPGFPPAAGSENGRGSEHVV